jgi:hypothetical protein
MKGVLTRISPALYSISLLLVKLFKGCWVKFDISVARGIFFAILKSLLRKERPLLPLKD